MNHVLAQNNFSPHQQLSPPQNLFPHLHLPPHQQEPTHHHSPLCSAGAAWGDSSELCRDKSRSQSSGLFELRAVPGGRAGAREEVPHPQLQEEGHHAAWKPEDCIQVIRWILDE